MLIQNQKGFTLIELLIVIAILGLLSGLFHHSIQETYRRHAVNSRDQKLVWLLTGQEAILRITPYQELQLGEHKTTPEMLTGAGIPSVRGTYITEELRPGLKRITITAGYPAPTGRHRSLSVVIYRSNKP